jgi:putative ABC transport system substrate-binding protein
MKRREFLAGLFAASIPAMAAAQARPRITIVHGGFPRRTSINLLFEALGKLGYEDGRSAAIEMLGAEGDPDRLKALVAQLPEQKPDVIIAITTPAVLAIKAAALTTPAVFAFVPDPVGQGIVESLARPGGNFTGMTYSEVGLGGKRLELLTDAIAGMTTVAALWSPLFPGNAAAVESIRRSASTRRIEVFSRELKGLATWSPRSTMLNERKRKPPFSAPIICCSAIAKRSPTSLSRATALRLPSIFQWPENAEEGALAGYGPRFSDLGRQRARQLIKVLRGAKPADIPVEQPTRFELVINLKTAKAIGHEVPAGLVLRADKLIE